MKTRAKQSLVAKISTVLFLLFLLFFINAANNKAISQNLVLKNQELPAHLIIPAIAVSSNIQHLGVTPQGGMEVPSNALDVGWFKFGPLPGKRGSAVIVGHFNGINDETGVFANLHELKKGDKIYVKNNKGVSTAFIISESRIYDPGYAENVFSRNDGIHLNLVTCDGVWDGVKKNYSKRLVVFADVVY